jgi:hypothetical protein
MRLVGWLQWFATQKAVWPSSWVHCWVRALSTVVPKLCYYYYCYYNNNNYYYYYNYYSELDLI